MSIEIKMVKGGYQVEGEFFSGLSSALRTARKLAKDYTDMTGVPHSVVYDMGVF